MLGIKKKTRTKKDLKTNLSQFQKKKNEKM